jgi:hypothetical protein
VVETTWAVAVPAHPNNTTKPNAHNLFMFLPG